MIVLDTNVFIGIMNRRDPRLKALFDVVIKSARLAMCAICLCELRYGIAKSKVPDISESRLPILLRMPIKIVDFDADDAREAALIRASLERAGTPIGPYDILIAAQARRRAATLVTANTREFSRVPGLLVEDWTQP